MTEYALVLAAVAVLAFGAYQLLGVSNRVVVNSVNQELSGPPSPSGGG
jgi:hypothetical protein